MNDTITIRTLTIDRFAHAFMVGQIRACAVEDSTSYGKPLGRPAWSEVWQKYVMMKPETDITSRAFRWLPMREISQIYYAQWGAIEGTNVVCQGAGLGSISGMRPIASLLSMISRGRISFKTVFPPQRRHCRRARRRRAAWLGAARNERRPTIRVQVVTEARRITALAVALTTIIAVAVGLITFTLSSKALESFLNFVGS